VTVATAKAERLLNLVIALVNSPRYRTALWIRDKVAGYADAPNDEAFFRTFERDKQELRELGIPLQTPPAGEDPAGGVVTKGEVNREEVRPFGLLGHLETPRDGGRGVLPEGGCGELADDVVRGPDQLARGVLVEEQR
jgi:hypothetical protein